MGIKTGKKALFTEINITPLTDIFLVLLIIMMVVAPTFQSVDNSISVPEVNSGTAIEQGKVTVSVTKDGTVYVGDKRSSISMLSTDSAQDAHYKKLIVAGEPLNKKDQKKLEEAQSIDTTPLPQDNQYDNWSE